MLLLLYVTFPQPRSSRLVLMMLSYTFTVPRFSSLTFEAVMLRSTRPSPPLSNRVTALLPMLSA